VEVLRSGGSRLFTAISGQNCCFLALAGSPAFRPESGTKVPGQSIKKDDEAQGLFDFSIIAA
jgi:hypothetical protein